MSDWTNLLSLRALLALRYLELDALVLVEAAVTISSDRRVVHEHVSSVAVRGNETEALFRVEPLDGALNHLAVSSSGHVQVCTLQTSGRAGPDGKSARCRQSRGRSRTFEEMQLQPRERLARSGLC